MSVTFHYVGQTLESIVKEIPSPTVYPIDDVWTVLWKDGDVHFGVGIGHDRSGCAEGILDVDQPDNLDILESRGVLGARVVRNGQFKLEEILMARGIEPDWIS